MRSFSTAEELHQASLDSILYRVAKLLSKGYNPHIEELSKKKDKEREPEDGEAMLRLSVLGW